jgi:hypothetical protein
MATYYVDKTTGNDSDSGLTEALAWETIAKVNASSFSPGDNVLFRRGETWNEALVVPSEGSAGAPLTFGVYGTGAKPILRPAAAKAFYGDYRDYITVDNLSMGRGDNAGKVLQLDGFVSGADGEGSHHWTITDCDFDGPIHIFGTYNVVDGCTVTGANNKGSAGLYNTGILLNWAATHHNTIRNCTIHDIVADANGTARGIWCQGLGCEYNNFLDNTVYGITLTASYHSQGIDCDTATGTDNQYGNVVSGNTIYDCHEMGIQFENNFDGEISGNYLYSSTPGTYLSQPIKLTAYLSYRGVDSNNLVSNNVIRDCGGVGAIGNIYLNDCGGVKIYHNTIVNPKGSAIGLVNNALGYCDGTQVIGNVFVDNQGTRRAISLEAAGDWAIFNTIFAAIHHNCFYDLDVPDHQYEERATSTYKAVSDIQGTPWFQDVGSIVSDPQFLDKAGADYHLQSDSPCIGAAVNGTVAQDFDGIPRGRGSADDIGAFETLKGGPRGL